MNTIPSWFKAKSFGRGIGFTDSAFYLGDGGDWVEGGAFFFFL